MKSLKTGLHIHQNDYSCVQENVFPLCAALTEIAGAGKTFVLSRVIDFLEERFKHDNKVAVVYFYLDHEAQQQQTPTKIMSTLLKQLVHSLPVLPSTVKAFYDEHASVRSAPEPQDLSRLTELLFEICTNIFRTVFVAFVALDECTEGTLTNILSIMQKCWKMPSIKFIATSRPHPSRVHDLLQREETVDIEINADDSDIKNFLQMSMVEPTTSHLSAGMKAEIINTLGTNAQGMFLLVRLRLDNVLRCKASPTKTREALETLPSDLSAAYSNVMNRIRNEGSETEALAVLSWINLAKRPLTMGELREAVSVRHGQKSLDRSLLPQPQVLIDICQGLVVHRSDGVVQFAHFTVQEYLQSQHSSDLLSNVDIARACLTYLLFEELYECLRSLADEFLDTVVLDFAPFTKYASDHWHDHMRGEGEIDNSAQCLLFRLLGVDEQVRTCVLLLGSPKSLLRQCRSPLHRVVAFGFSIVLTQLLNQDIPGYEDLAAKLSTTERYGSSVHIAVIMGRLSCLKILLKNCVDVSIRNMYGETALHAAAGSNFEEAVRLLLEGGADVTARDMMGYTALHYAGRVSIIELLLRAGADISARSNRGLTPLMCIHEADIADILIENGADCLDVDGDGNTALHHAVLGSPSIGEGICRRLLEQKPEMINFLNYLGQTAFFRAMHCLNLVVPRVLAEYGADVSLQDHTGRTTLQNYLYVISQRRGFGKVRFQVVKFLLDVGIDILNVDKRGLNALDHARKVGHVETIELLTTAMEALESGSSCLTDDTYGSRNVSPCEL